MATYIGFSTINKSKKFKVNDFELVKADLYNHLNIRKGEKLMDPNFGTIIWNLLFEPLTTEVKKAMMDDIGEILAYDPRLSADSITISEYEHGIQILMDLRYIPTNQTEQLKMSFDRNSLS